MCVVVCVWVVYWRSRVIGFELSAAQNYFPCLYKLGTCLEEGLGCAIDLDRALAVYERSAAGHHPRAKWRLARLFAAGIGVARDVDKATDLFLGAAEEGVSEARDELLALK